MGGIFINYRSGNHAVIVHALYERLAGYFGEESVFLDKPSIHAGSRYPDEIKKRLMDSDVLIAVIHDGWLNERDADGARLLDRDRDWVRMELEIALASDKMIVPILADDAVLPQADELPTSISDLAHRQARRVLADAVSRDTRALIEELERDVAPTWAPGEAEPAQAIRRPFRVPIAVAIALLVAPPLCTIGSHASMHDNPPPTIYLALLSVFVMLARLIAGVPVFLGQRGINSLEREIHPMPPMRFHRRIGIPLTALLYVFCGAIVIAGAILSHLSRLAVYAVIATVFLVFVTALIRTMLLVSREERSDDERAKHWPKPLPVPPDPLTLRREVSLLDDRLGMWKPPLSREQRDKAQWMLGAVKDSVAESRHRTARTRRLWLLTDHPVRMVGYLWWTAGTIGMLAAAVVPRIVGRLLSPTRGSVTIVAGAVIVCLILWAILELDYRRQRSRTLAVAADVTGDVERLTQRLAELLQPPGTSR
ncbi:MAG TPA: toll/interleukin-1 receptor domain-containing protein [Pseudonocardiaceae bacterium]|jgi:hypothetical protein|nr:toll/interleukin-1 receptor domain-containing protein [Pseudonocardiaceae bacterium]